MVLNPSPLPTSFASDCKVLYFKLNVLEGTGNLGKCPGPYMVRTVQDHMTVWSYMVDSVLDISNHIGPFWDPIRPIRPNGMA